MEDFINTTEDFNQPGPKRIDLLKRLQELAGDLPPHFWAACQICDLDALHEFLRYKRSAVKILATQTSQMVRHWGSSPRYQSQPSTPKTPIPQRLAAIDSGPSSSTSTPPAKRQKTINSPKTILSRDANTKKRARERDNFSCVLTGVELIEVAYIYPYHSIKQQEEAKIILRQTFWDHLRIFWSEEKVTTWEGKMFPQGIYGQGQEEVYNLISLSPTVYTIWGRGLFALKPISESDDKKTLRVQFFWQEKQGGLLPLIDLTTIPISIQGLTQTSGAHGGHIWLFDKNEKKIQSGDYFELQTNDLVQNHCQASSSLSCNGSFTASRAWQVLLTLIGRRYTQT